ncbi:MAG: hypothetical protein ACREAG_01965 [Nitrosopumilaceae archaeon]
MGLDVIEEKNLNDVIEYALDYPNVVLAGVKSILSQNVMLGDFGYGLYLGYVSGVFFDGFLRRNSRFLNDEEMSGFHAVLFKRSPEILLKIKVHLGLK